MSRLTSGSQSILTDLFPLHCLFPRAQLCFRVLLSGPLSLPRLFPQTQPCCPVLTFRPGFIAPSLLMDPVTLSFSSHGPSSFARLFPRIQLCCLVLSFRPIFVAPSLLTDPIPLPVSSHEPNSVACLFSRTQFRCSDSSYGPSSAVPSYILDPVPLLHLVSRTQFSAPCICPSYSIRFRRTQYSFSSLYELVSH